MDESIWLPAPRATATTGQVSEVLVQVRSWDCLTPVANEYLGTGVRCRHCVNCRRSRARRWFARTLWEVQSADLLGARAWFVTLTFRTVPLKPYEAIQSWLNLVRHQTPHPVRYVVVLEAGEATGRLHYHLIVCGGKSLHQRHLRSEWSEGISEAKLISGNQKKVAAYVCGYVAKAAIQVHASMKWGNPPGEAYLIPSRGKSAPKLKVPF